MTAASVILAPSISTPAATGTPLPVQASAGSAGGNLPVAGVGAAPHPAPWERAPGITPAMPPPPADAPRFGAPPILAPELPADPARASRRVLWVGIAIGAGMSALLLGLAYVLFLSR
ncbi:MAG: hypothetical protein R3F14_35650 [Polyangiaceae bacterium]